MLHAWRRWALLLVLSSFLSGCYTAGTLLHLGQRRPISELRLEVLSEAPGRIDVAWTARYGGYYASGWNFLTFYIPERPYGTSIRHGQFSITEQLAKDCTEYEVNFNGDRLRMPSALAPEGLGGRSAFPVGPTRGRHAQACRVYLRKVRLGPGRRRLTIVGKVGKNEIPSIELPPERTLTSVHKWTDFAVSPLPTAWELIEIPLQLISLLFPTIC